jgi:Protein of unknown function (DUF3306)
MGNLSAYFGRILTLCARTGRATNASVASTAPHNEKANGDANTKEQQGDGTRSALETLPAIDSITATTDIRAFLRPGVPDMLKHAALRQAWTTDPAIRDFIGIAENQWDFNKPQNIPGFGLLEPSENIQRRVATISIGRSMEGEKAPEQRLEAQKAPDNIGQIAAPDVEGHPARIDEAATNAASKSEDSKQTDV